MRQAPKQKTVTDLIIKDSKKIPDFIDPKKEAHKNVYLLMQSIFDTFSCLSANYILPDSHIDVIHYDVEYDFNLIKECLDTNTLLSINPDHQGRENQQLLFQIVKYLHTRLNYYLKTAVEFELYETAANIKNYLKD